MNTYRSTNPIQSPRKTFRIRWAEVAATAVVTGLVIGGTVWAFNTATSPSDAVTPACATDGSEATSEGASPSPDDTNCFWNAQTQGNGIGNSFYTDAAGNTYYLPETECEDNLEAWTRDASQMIEDMDSRWAVSAPYSVSVRTDNIDPMTSRLVYIVTELCK